MDLAPALKHSRTRGRQSRALPVIEVALAGCLRNHCERHEFRQAEFSRLLAEMDQARRGGAFDVRAVGHQVEVGLENVALGIQKLEFERARNLPELAADAAGVQAIDQARELHAYGR